MFKRIYHFRRVRLKHSIFARNKDRQNQPGYQFSRASFGLTTIGKLLVILFFTPIIIASDIVPEAIILMIANILLAISYLWNFVDRIIKKDISWAEAGLTVVGLLSATLLVVHLAPAIFAVDMSLTSILTCSSAVATGINTFFLVKNVFVPPLKWIVEHLFLYVGINIQGEYQKTPPFEAKKDRHVIELLLQEKLSDKNKDKLASYNKLLYLLDWYNNKYNEEILGNVFRQTKIEECEQARKELIVGNPSSALSIACTKQRYKKVNYDILLDGIEEIEQAIKVNDVSAYNSQCVYYFKNYVPIKTVSEVSQSWLNLRKLMSAEAERQKGKFQKCHESIPRGADGSEVELYEPRSRLL